MDIIRRRKVVFSAGFMGLSMADSEIQETENRRCIVTGEVKDKSALLRFTMVNDGMIVPDFKKKLKGRGFFVSVSKEILLTAVRKNCFSKASKGRAHTPSGLVDMVEALLKKRGLDMLNLARKAGCLVTGFEKVKEAVSKGKAAFLVEATDAGADGHDKISGAARGLEILEIYSIEELDKALDKVNTVHAAVLKGSMAKAVYTELKRYEWFLNS